MEKEKSTLDMILELIAQLESFSDLMVDKAVLLAWIDRLSDRERMIVDRYQDRRNERLDKTLKIINEKMKECEIDIKEIPDYFTINEN